MTSRSSRSAFSSFDGRFRVRSGAALICALSVVVTGCGSDKPSANGAAESTATETVAAVTTTTHGPSLTTAQASKLARILQKNHTAGGASVDGEVEFGTAATFHLKGVVDWTNAVGRVELTTTRSDGVEAPPQTIAWGGSSIYLSAPGLAEALAAQGHAGIQFLQRPVSVKTNPLDQVITLIASFSSTRAENPLLLRQGDTSFEGTGTLDGKPIEKLRFGQTVYSVADDGFAYQLDARFKSIQGPIVMRFSNHGPQNVPAIDPASVLPLSEFADLYDSLVRPSASSPTTTPAS